MQKTSWGLFANSPKFGYFKALAGRGGVSLEEQGAFIRFRYWWSKRCRNSPFSRSLQYICSLQFKSRRVDCWLKVVRARQPWRPGESSGGSRLFLTKEGARTRSVTSSPKWRRRSLQQNMARITRNRHLYCHVFKVTRMDSTSDEKKFFTRSH